MLRELENTANRTLTENGAAANRSTGSGCLDFFAVCGALREADEGRLQRLFIRAYAEDRDLAMRALLYCRDIRGGLGERRTFGRILSFLARTRPASVRKNLRLLPEYGRWDDLLPLLDTPCAGDAEALIRQQLRGDLEALREGGQVSLLAKWLPSVHTSSPLRRRQARQLCGALHMTEKEYRGTLSRLRTRIDVLEKRLCAGDYTFDYAKQPSGAMHKYRGAFLRNDHDRYMAYISQVLKGEARMHADTLYPYQILQRIFSAVDMESVYCGLPVSPNDCSEEETRSLDAGWKSLPDYGDGRNALAMVDGSGSMFFCGNPLPAAVAMSLGIYFAEHNRGYFRDHFMTFPRTPQLVKLKGETIVDRALYCMSYDEASNTDLRAALLLLLRTAIDHHLPQEELPETLYILSDMEFDEGVEEDRTLHQELRGLYERAGYRLPGIVYWNVCSRHQQFPVRMDENGTVLVSGAGPAVFRMVIGQDISPEKYMHSILDSERYRPICA